MKVISFVNMKGGVAKTTLAVNVAYCLSEHKHEKVILIDIDPQFNATQCLIAPESYKQMLDNDLSTIIDVFDYLPKAKASTVSGTRIEEPAKLEDIHPTRLTDNLYLLPGNIQLFRLEMSPGEGREYRLKRYLETISKEYNFAIIDTPPTPSVWMSTALIASDYYVVPCKPEPLSATGIDLLRMVVEHKKENYGLSIKCAGLVLTITEQHTKAYREAVDFIDKDPFWNSYRFKYELPKRTEIAFLQGTQQTIFQSKDYGVAMDIVRITDELLERINQ